jgi:transcriptional regulator with XRE-family HTH domain
VDTNEAIRQRVSRLVDLGVSQKVLAKKMGLTETRFSRWLNQKRDVDIPVSAMDGFIAYIDELADAIRDTEPTGDDGAPAAGWPRTSKRGKSTVHERRSP